MENVFELKEAGESRTLNLALGIVFNTETKKILLVRRKNSEWCFPGGKIGYSEDLESELKEQIKAKTGLRIESLGAIFAEANLTEFGGILSIYYLCEFVDGEENLYRGFEEAKWVSAEEIGDYLKTKLHPSLKEYLTSLK